MELRDYLRVLHKYWISIVAITLTGVIAAAGATLLMKPTYEATTQLYVSVRGESSAVGDLAQGSNVARQSVATYAGIATKDIVLAPVVEELNLERTATELANDVTASAPVNQSLVSITVTGREAERTAKIANAIGESLKNIVENQLEAGAGTDEPSLVSLDTVQPALVPTEPSSPKLKLNLAIGLLLGLAAGVGMAVLRSVLDTRIHTDHDIEAITEAPLLGGITFDPEAKSRPLVVQADPRSPRSESFRTLRTNLQFLNVQKEEGRAKSYVISSAGPSEGKSTTTANLAIALAETGARVVLIDGDLRKPKVAQYMGIEGGAGLTNVLANQAELTDVMQRWGRGQLYVLPAGKVPPNPSELLGSGAMHDLLAQLKEHFDYILIDAPPLLLVTDAAVVSKYTNGVLLVAASGSTRKQELGGAVRTLQVAGAKLLGIIVTMLPTKGPDSYGYGAYGAYGGYGEQVDGAAQISDTDSVRVIQASARRRTRDRS